MCRGKRRTALQKDILRLADQYGKITPDIVSEHYDETYWTIKKNLYHLESEGLLTRTHVRRLEFVTNLLSCDSL